MYLYLQKPAHKKLLIIWSLVLLLLPLLSVFGRTLQTAVQDYFSRQELAIVVLSSLSIMVILISIDLSRHRQYRNLWHLLWFLPIFILYPMTMPIIEERVHFITFGLLGYLSPKVFVFRFAILICVIISAGDELLQWFLPDRVGDWHDVMINCAASIAGAIMGQISNDNRVR